jgi:hypothetical protein
LLMGNQNITGSLERVLAEFHKVTLSLWLRIILLQVLPEAKQRHICIHTHTHTHTHKHTHNSHRNASGSFTQRHQKKQK